VAKNEIKRLDQIIRNFLQAIRPVPVNLQTTDVVAVLEEVLTVLRAEMEGAQIRVEVELPSVLPMVMADVEQIKQVYFNLLKNAREAMEPGGMLKIRATADDEWLKLHFTDNGGGINPEILEKIFEPYFSTRDTGTGLGLYMSRQIIERSMGGRITARNIEGGAEFLVSVPLA